MLFYSIILRMSIQYIYIQFTDINITDLTTKNGDIFSQHTYQKKSQDKAI
jgi:hypothetical protein